MLGKLVGMPLSALMRMITATLLVAGVTACGSTPATKGAKPTNLEGATDGDVARNSSGSTAGSEAAGPLEFAAPDDRACMFHQESSGFFACLSGADGQCFHYGAVCEPADTCVPDLSSGEFRHCKKFTEGRCERFDASCKPGGTCLYDTAARRYRTCSKPSDGGCSEFGATCDP